jgi:hypothetical protein
MDGQLSVTLILKATKMEEAVDLSASEYAGCEPLRVAKFLLHLMILPFLNSNQLSEVRADWAPQRPQDASRRVANEGVSCVSLTGPTSDDNAGSFTTFPVDAALQRSIHRPACIARNRNETRLFRLFLAI